MDVEAILLVTAALIGIVGTHSCSLKEFERCLKILQSVAQSEGQKQAATREELDQVCQQLQNGVKCVDEHSYRCFDSAEQRIFDSVVSESRQVISDLCVGGELQDDYLKYAPCFRNISADETKCATKYKKMAVLSQGMEGEDKEMGLKKFCCAMTDFAKCKHEFVIRDCGPMASQFLQRHMDRMSGSLLNQHCVLYTFGSDSCTDDGGTQSGGESTILMFISLLALVYHVRNGPSLP